MLRNSLPSALLLLLAASLFMMKKDLRVSASQARKTAMLEKFSRPADHFFLQRSYPEFVFDEKAYVRALRDAASTTIT